MSPSATYLSAGSQHHFQTHHNYFHPHRRQYRAATPDHTQKQSHRPVDCENNSIYHKTSELEPNHMESSPYLSRSGYSPQMALSPGPDHRLSPGGLDCEERSRRLSDSSLYGHSPGLPKSPFSTSESDRGDSPEPQEEPTNFAPLSLVCRWKRCSRKFSSQRELAAHVNDDHVRIEQPDTDFQCRWKGCPRQGRGFNARYKMLIHIRTHTNEKPHKCSVCGKCFSRLENLKIHTRSHTGEKPYVCTFAGCGKAYSNSSDRFKHVRTHQEEKPYKCKLPGCRKQYTDPSSLRKHVRTHRHHMGTEEASEFLYSGPISRNDESFASEDMKSCLSPSSPTRNSLFPPSQLRNGLSGGSCSPDYRSSLDVFHNFDIKSPGSIGNRRVPSLSGYRSDIEEESDCRYEASDYVEAKVSSRTDFNIHQHSEVPNKNCPSRSFNIPQIVINSDCLSTCEGNEQDNQIFAISDTAGEYSTSKNARDPETAEKNSDASNHSLNFSSSLAKKEPAASPSLKRPFTSEHSSKTPHKGHWKKLCIMKSESEEQKESTPTNTEEEIGNPALSDKTVTHSPNTPQTCPSSSETSISPASPAPHAHTLNTSISPVSPNANQLFVYSQQSVHHEDTPSASLFSTGRPSAFTTVQTARQRRLSIPSPQLAQSTSPSLPIVPSLASIPSPSMPPSPGEFYSFPSYRQMHPTGPPFSPCSTLPQPDPRQYAAYLKGDNILSLPSHPATICCARDDIIMRRLPYSSALSDLPTPTSGFSVASGAPSLGFLYPDVAVDLSQYHSYFGLDPHSLPYHRVTTR